MVLFKYRLQHVLLVVFGTSHQPGLKRHHHIGIDPPYFQVLMLFSAAWFWFFKFYFGLFQMQSVGMFHSEKLVNIFVGKQKVPECKCDDHRNT